MVKSSLDVKEHALRHFEETLRGSFVRSTDPEYDDARSVWNGRVDKYPAAIARCAGPADVITAVEFAREHDVRLAVRGGGHHVSGAGVCDDGLVIDLSAMDAVRVDPNTETARVGGGAIWETVNHETQAFGLATTGGRPAVGVGGYTLGGGHGFLERAYGLAVDNLRSADVVTANGRLVRASEDENSDLFWALRGGGGNFGVVTSFEFELHEVGPKVLAGTILHPVERASEVLEFHREFMADAPNEAHCYVAFVQIPPLPEFPSSLHGETYVALMPFYAGDVSEGEDVLKPIREFGDPIVDLVYPQQYTSMGREFQQTGNRNYWKSCYLSDLSAEAIDTVTDYASPIPSQFTVVTLIPMGGEIGRPSRDETAFAHRDATYLLSIYTQWTDPERDDELVEWTRAFQEAMAPYSTGGEYVNNQTERDRERIRAAYGDNFDRLKEIKETWDPDNLFRVNQNVEPSG